MNPRFTVWLLFAALAASPAWAGDAGDFVLEGDLSALYASGDFVVWTPKKAAPGKPAMSMSLSTATAADKPASEEPSMNVIARAPLQADGTFRVAGNVEAPHRVFFYVLDAIGHQGRRLAPVKGNAFILEPGHLRLYMSQRGRFHIEGGRYNDAVFNSWRRSEPYLQAQAEYADLLGAPEGETEAERRARTDAAAAVFSGILDLETEGRKRVASTHPDPLVRKLTLETTWLGGPWMLEAYRGLAAMTPDDAWVVERLARAEEGAVKRAAERKRFAIGAGIRDFEAQTLECETIRLADVRANSRVVLV